MTTARQQSASRQLYDLLARIDPQAIYPVMRPLVRDFIQTIPLQMIAGIALDVGTGFGFAAHTLAEMQRNLSIVGLDLSAAMLRVAEAQHNVANPVRYVCADIVRPPFPPGVFDIITASFGLSLTTPRQSLPLLGRLLKPGGHLLIQEWAAEDALTTVFDQVFGEHTEPDTVFDQLLADLPDVWSAQMQDVDDYHDHLQAAGFAITRISEEPTAPIYLESASVFVAYKLAWPTYRVRWDRLNSVGQRALYTELISAVLAAGSADRSLVWQPKVFRAMARRIS